MEFVTFCMVGFAAAVFFVFLAFVCHGEAVVRPALHQAAA